jgi:hypothetical protein
MESKEEESTGKALKLASTRDVHHIACTGLHERYSPSVGFLPVECSPSWAAGNKPDS